MLPFYYFNNSAKQNLTNIITISASVLPQHSIFSYELIINICSCYKRFIIVTNTTMKIANQNTFQQFDKLRQQIFAHKQKQVKHKKQVKNPFSSKFRFVLPMALLVGGSWLVYHNLPNMKDYLIQKKIVSHHQYLLFESLRTFVKCKFSESFSFKEKKSDPQLANGIYLTKLQSDYLYLKERMPEKVLQVNTKTNFSFWIFNWGISETIHFINEYGDLVSRHKNYKFSLGQMLSIWGKTQEAIVKRNKIFDCYLNERQREYQAKNCENLNIFTKMLYSSQEYINTLEACKQREARIKDKIQSFIDERLKKEVKRKIKDNSKQQTTIKQE